MGTHVHIHAGKSRLHAGFSIVLGDAVDHTLADGVGVAYHKAVKAEFLLQDIAQQPAVHRAGHAV